jgi:DNA-binding GntR family transcriptional regulator
MERLLPLARVSDQLAPNTFEDFQSEVALHTALVELADCAPLLSAFRRVIRVGLFLAINMMHPHTLPMAPNAHTRLLKDLRTPDPDLAERIMRDHLTGRPSPSRKGRRS